MHTTARRHIAASAAALALLTALAASGAASALLAGCSSSSGAADAAAGGDSADASSNGDGGAGDGAAGDGAASDAGTTVAEVPLAAEIEPGVYRELVTIPAPAPPPSPKSNTPTPARYNTARFLRYRAAATPGQVRAIIVAMPGMPAGAMAYDYFARRLIKLSGGSVEIWAIDRRANQLEDLTGMNAAEVTKDPDLAWRYYDNGHRINGKRYAGLPPTPRYMSEWGLAAHVADLRAVLALVPEVHRRARVILVGHSFGAAFVQAYAAWNIGSAGAPKAAASELAGLALLDGGLFLYSEIGEAAYKAKGNGVAPGLDTLRDGTRLYLDYVGFGLEVFMTVEVTALRAHLAPRAVVNDPHVTRIATLLFLKQPPPMTAAALVGFTLDEASSPVAGLRARCGAPKGPTELYDSPLGGPKRVRPARSDITYDWLDYDQVTPPEYTSIAVLARTAHEGPTNRIEWFMPARLSLDVSAVSSLTMTASSWQSGYGLAATENAAMDAPVLVMPAGLGIAPSAARFERYRKAITPTVGAGRPRAGADRTPTTGTGGGFSVISLPDHAHDDLVHGSGDRADKQIYQPLLDWILANVQPGTVVIPRAPRGP